VTSPRRKQGATLALVISLVFVFLLVGAAFFIWQLLVGGGKELQHATDSGNLNVAKQSLKTPSYTVPDSISPITNTNLRTEFKDVIAADNNQVNLLNFNRLVGKAIFAQLNAKAEGTNEAKTNADQITQAVYSIGQQLQNQLAASSSLKSQFEGISNQNSTRMLDHPNGATGPTISQTDSEYQIAYMARGHASNVFIDPSQYPVDASGNPITLSANDTVTKDVNGNHTFLKGYTEFSSDAGITSTKTYAIPLRPGEQPHLVGIEDFNRNATAPFPNALPNAFKSGGQATFVRTGANVGLRSCAVVGVLEKTFPITSPGGVIIIDNTGNTISSVVINDGGSTIFAGPMMAPKGIEIFSCTANSGTFPARSDGTGRGGSRMYMGYYDGSGALPSDTIKGHAQSTQDSNVMHQDPENSCRSYPENGMLDGSDIWGFTMHNQTRYVSRFAERCQIMGTAGAGAPGTTIGGTATKVQHIATCNNMSFDSGGGGDSSPQCTDENNTKNVFPSFLNGDVGVHSGDSGSTTYSDLMPLEQYILAVHGGFGGSAGCVSVPALGSVGTCAINGRGSGLKHIQNSLPPWSPGTLDQLLSDTNTPPAVHEDLARRMRQIAPNADPNSIFTQVIPFNKIVYISGNGPNQLVMSTSSPSTLQYNYTAQINNPNRPVVTNHIPDGNPINGTHTIPVSGTWVPGSYWECGSGRQTGQSSSVSKWFPSSGKGGLLGVLRFNNCPEADGPDWCCP
jgi:hypothetical protein